MSDSAKQKAAGNPRQAPHDPVAGFAGSIAHDLSNMLLVIANSAEYLKADLGPDDPRQEYVAALLEAAERARRLTGQLQAFGRSQLLKPELVQPARIVREITDTLRHLVPEDIEFRVSVRAADAVVTFDAAQLPVVIINLVTVAAEAARTHGRLLLSVLAEVVKESKGPDDIPPGAYVVMLVAIPGTGAGSDAARAAAFGPRLTSRQLPRGTDLRLASAHGIVTQSGGYMDLHSDPKHGTVFRVYLPQSIATVQAARLPAQTTDLGGNEVILVVEDDAAVRSTVREALERYGYSVYEASNGAEALHMTTLFNAPPDLLLADLVMPEVTGRELIESLRHEGRLPRVLLMSGYTDDDAFRRASPSDTYPFIRKPFTLRELAAKVRETLDAPLP